jgi:hypothetical protein
MIVFIFASLWIRVRTVHWGVKGDQKVLWKSCEYLSCNERSITEHFLSAITIGEYLTFYPTVYANGAAHQSLSLQLVIPFSHLWYEQTIALHPALVDMVEKARLFQLFSVLLSFPQKGRYLNRINGSQACP